MYRPKKAFTCSVPTESVHMYRPPKSLNPSRALFPYHFAPSRFTLTLQTRIHIHLSAHTRVPAQMRTDFAQCTPRIFFSPLHSNGHVPCPLRSALHASAHHVRRTGQITSASRTEQAIAERLWRARSAPTGQSLCESYFGITRVDGGGVHTPHERERWPAIVSGSRREWSHHITPAIPTGCDPSSIRRYE